MKTKLSAIALAMGFCSIANAAVVADFRADYTAVNMPAGWTYGYCPWNNHDDIHPFSWDTNLGCYATADGLSGPYISNPDWMQLGGGNWLVASYTLSNSGVYNISGAFTTANNSVDGMLLIVRTSSGDWYYNNAGGYLDTTTFSLADLTLAAGTSINFIWDGHANTYGDNIRFDAAITTSDVPEPATLGLVGLAGLALLLRRK